jgi:hypothetical protein
MDNSSSCRNVVKGRDLATGKPFSIFIEWFENFARCIKAPVGRAAAIAIGVSQSNNPRAIL